jgi:glyceraldehyde-3-phosphate dehydrogenase (NADP+)
MSGVHNHLFYNPNNTETVPVPELIIGDKYLIHGEIQTWTGKVEKVYSPIYNAVDGTPIQIGTYAYLGEKEAVEAIQSAKSSFNNGRGEWPSMTAKQRIECVQKFVKGMKDVKKQIVQAIMWEICKTTSDAEKEVDRTIAYIYDTIAELKRLENQQSMVNTSGGISAQIKRSPLGVCVCVAPANYPLNETYTTLLPALLMGNTIVLKTPRNGCLCHMPTIELFQQFFPKGTVNIVHGSGRETLPAMMKTGLVDILAFIGSHKAAHALQVEHPHPFKLRCVFGLDAKNAGFILPDADLKVTVSECLLGSLSFNGQRCTALKILFVHESIAQEFVDKFSAAVDALKIGLPWEKDVKITPVLEPGKPKYLKELIDDAVNNGAKIVNKNGGQIDRSIVAPTVLYPVTPNMRVYKEEQFGPVVPIVAYSNIEECIEYAVNSTFGQQASIFSNDPHAIPELLDVLTHQVSRINLNSQCQRGPDNYPFTGRKDSACGTLSVHDALRAMSIRAMVACKEDEKSLELMTNIITSRKSNFLRADYLQ